MINTPDAGVEETIEHFDVSLGDPPFMIYGDAVIIGDVHVPCTDYGWARLAGIVGEKYLPRGKRNLIIAGDLVNMDWASRYEVIEGLPAWQQEKAAARQLITEYADIFDHIYYIMGNHERRLAKFTHAALGAQDLADMFYQDEKFKTSEWGWCTLRSGDVEYRVTHGRSYSVNQLTVGSELALKFQQNIISHHQHMLAIGWDKFKRYVVIDNGALVDQNKLSYVVRDDGKLPNMAKGFCLVKNGIPHLLGEYPFTDWPVIVPEYKEILAKYNRPRS